MELRSCFQVVDIQRDCGLFLCLIRNVKHAFANTLPVVADRGGNLVKVRQHGTCKVYVDVVQVLLSVKDYVRDGLASNRAVRFSHVTY